MLRHAALALGIVGALMLPSETFAGHGGGHGGKHHGGGPAANIMGAVIMVAANIMATSITVAANTMGMDTMVVGITVVGTRAMAATGTVVGTIMA